jgi:hypothetical protein
MNTSRSAANDVGEVSLWVINCLPDHSGGAAAWPPISDTEPDDWRGRDEPIGTILRRGNSKRPGILSRAFRTHVA